MRNIIMNHMILGGLISILILACGKTQVSSEEKSFKAVYKVYKDYLFEYKIDSTRFMPPIHNIKEDSRSYKWLAVNSNGDTVGVEVLVSIKDEEKIGMRLIGGKDAWLPFLREQEISP